MARTLKPGDRVRLKDTVSFGTVVRIFASAAGGGASAVVVEWDGPCRLPDAVRAEDISFVRSPPHSRCWYDGPLPFCDW